MTVGPATKAKTDTVLLVESEILVRAVLAEYLRQCGYQVVEAVNGEEALLVLQSPIEISVVLSAVEMPGSIDGFALATWVRRHRTDVRVILAGNPRRAADAAGDLCQSGPLLSKPYEPQAVVERIRRLLAEQTSRKPQSRKVSSIHSEMGRREATQSASRG
jgi:DNA-binding NtrC family response regulator